MNMPGSSDVGLIISDSHRSQRVRFREPTVLMTITCLMLLSGMTTTVENAKLKDISTRRVLSLWKLCHSIIPLPALYMFKLLSDYTGRKPVIIFLFLLSTLTSILHSMSLENTWLLLAFILQGILKGGTIVMTFLAIWEYSSSKHKLTYLLANAGVMQMGEYFTKTVLYGGHVLENDSLHMKGLPVVLGLLCLGWIWQWPEPPYWLASKGKLDEGRTAFLWLHGEEGEAELQGLLQAPPVTEPPKSFHLSFLITIFSTSLYRVAVWNKSYTGVNTSFEFISKEFKTALLVCSTLWIVGITVAILHNIKHKFVLLTILGFFAVLYIFGYLEDPMLLGPHPTLVHAFSGAPELISKSGPILLGLFFAAMAVPQKYRSFAYECFWYIQLGISAIVLTLAIIIFYE